MPFASVYPLVSARALARPFTYEVPDEVGKGAVVSVAFGRSRRRGVVVSTGDDPPPGIEPVAIGRVLDEVSPALVDLALWIADYYGSTPARALELVAPHKPSRRKEQAPPAERHAFGGEARPKLLTETQAAADEKGADTFGAMELVCGEAHGVEL